MLTLAFWAAIILTVVFLAFSLSSSANGVDQDPTADERWVEMERRRKEREQA